MLHVDIRIVLCGNDYCVNADRLAVFIVFNGDLALAVRTEIAEMTALANFRQAAGQLVRKADGQRHTFGSFIAGISEHHALIARTDIIGVGVAVFCFLSTPIAISGDCPFIALITARVWPSKPYSGLS